MKVLFDNKREHRFILPLEWTVFSENKNIEFEICFRFFGLRNDFLRLQIVYCGDCQVEGGSMVLCVQNIDS